MERWSEGNGSAKTHPSQKRRLRHARRSSEISLVAVREDDETAVVSKTKSKQRITPSASSLNPHIVKETY